MHRSLHCFQPPVREWFSSALGEPTRVQALGWPLIARGESVLLLAPTGSGKTLAAFLSAIDRLAFAPTPQNATGELRELAAGVSHSKSRGHSKSRRGTPRAKGLAADGGCRVLYVSPLKALAVDVERNLRAPLAGIQLPRVPTVMVRTGDTPEAERVRMRRHPPEILITTPESLYLLLSSSTRSVLSTVETVIIDEIHSLVPTKRGAHLFLSLERLEELVGRPIQRIGLSATQRPIEEVARVLGGNSGPRERRASKKRAERPVAVVDVGRRHRFDLRIEVPDVDLADLSAARSDPLEDRSIWPHVHKRLVELVRTHRSTLIFVNSRRLAERLAAALNEAAGESIASAHHGSVAREKRQGIEDRLKRGELPAIVATSSLELGIDMGAIELVVLIEAPPSVASGLQRIGRAGHHVGGTPRGTLFPKHRADLIACAAAVEAMREGAVEETFAPANPLDVLAQQVVATVASALEPVPADALYDLVRRAAQFAALPRTAFEGVLDMLSGRYPSEEFAELRPRLTWDRARNVLTPRKGALRLAVINGGTIPDRGLYGVFLAGAEGKTSRRVGELDEEMVFELREGEVFLLGASSWRVEEITRDRVLVSPAGGQPGKMPFWHGDRSGRSYEFGRRVGALTRRVAGTGNEAAAVELGSIALSPSAVDNLVRYVHEQREATGSVPSDSHLILERFVDELGDWRVCLLSPFGSRVHAPWANAVLPRIRETCAGDVETVWSDDGIVFRLPQTSTPPPTDWFFPDSGEVERLVTNSLGGTPLFASRFREAAARALLLPKRQPGKRTALWAQRKRSADLLAVASRFPDFPMLLETYRECLRDVFDLAALVEILRSVEARRIHVTTVDTPRPSPFASSLLFSFVANFIYEGDAPIAERRAQALTIDHTRLRELLGESELRQLLDPEVIREHERRLQHLSAPATHVDAVHDLLLRLGDLAPDELQARCQPRTEMAAWVLSLRESRRIVEVRVVGEKRFIATEDVARYRDAIGVVPPRGVARSHLEPVRDALGDLLGRYARTHGPFTATAVAKRFGLDATRASEGLAALVRAGRIEEGAFLPHGREREFCSRDVLRVLRSKSLARLRKEVEPVDAAAYARFLTAWHRIGENRRGHATLLEVVSQLQGCALPATTLLDEILPARVPGFDPRDLDALCASGEVTWAGIETLGMNDGRVALYLADHEELLALRGAAGKPEGPAQGDLHRRIRELLERRGAIFFTEMARTLGGYPGEVFEALWDLVWAGDVTSDTMGPLRSWLASRGSRSQRSGRGRRAPARSGMGRLAPSGPPGSEGRWSLRSSRWTNLDRENVPNTTDRMAHWANVLIERYGVLTREVAAVEPLLGGFGPLYQVLKGMEEAGRLRRGYFVAGRGATQFARPGAEDRLRMLRDSPAEADADVRHLLVLAATDPANPYGGLVPWPAHPSGRTPQRSAGSRVVLRDGDLLAWIGRGDDQLLTYLSEGALEADARDLVACLRLSYSSSGRRLTLRSIDGADAVESPHAEGLVQAGLVRRGDTLTLPLDARDEAKGLSFEGVRR